MGKNDSANMGDLVSGTADSEKAQEQLAVVLTPDNKSKILEEIMYLETRIEVLHRDYKIMVESLEEESPNLALEESTEKSSQPWHQRTALKVARWIVDRPEAKVQKIEPTIHTAAEKKFIAKNVLHVQQQIEKLTAERDQKMALLDSTTRSQLEAKSNVVSIRDFAAKKSAHVIALAEQAANTQVLPKKILEVAPSEKVTQPVLTKELSPENAAQLLLLLKERFLNEKKPYKSAEGVKWEDIQQKLENSPEKLWSLQAMEDTGGKPDLIEYDKKTGEYIFMDCSAESPTNRRNCLYDWEAEEYLRKNHPDGIWSGNAIGMAIFMGVDILNEKEYRELQTKGKFDKKSWSWIKTSIEKRNSGVALLGVRFDDVNVYVYEFLPYSHGNDRGWRGSLRLK